MITAIVLIAVVVLGSVILVLARFSILLLAANAARKKFVIRRIKNLFERGILTRVGIQPHNYNYGDVYGPSGHMSTTFYLDTCDLADLTGDKFKFAPEIVVALAGFSHDEIVYAVESLKPSLGFSYRMGPDGYLSLSYSKVEPVRRVA